MKDSQKTSWRNVCHRCKASRKHFHLKATAAESGGVQVSIGALTEPTLRLRNWGEESWDKFTGGWTVEKSQNSPQCLPPPPPGAPSVAGTMRSGRCFRGVAGGKGEREDGKEAGRVWARHRRAGSLSGRAGWAAERPSLPAQRAGRPGCLPSASPTAPGGRMNLERLRKRVRQYIDQVRRGGSGRRGGVGFAGQGAVGFPSEPGARGGGEARGGGAAGAGLCSRGGGG